MKIYIETLGCPKNVVDSEEISGRLIKDDNEIVKVPDEADIILVNTCGFINDAKQESIDRVLELAEYKKSRCKTLIVTGCLSERYGEELFAEMPEADVIMGVNDYENISDIIKKTQVKDSQRALYLSPSSEKYVEMGDRVLSTAKQTAYVKISEGCDNYCSYCSIPYIRGPYRSRPFESIINEAQKLSAEGCAEIILVAQDVTNYGIDLYGKYRIHELANELSQIEGIKWIRLMYCYPQLITDELIQVMAQKENICKYIDLPIQHCSNHILEAMNRRVTKDEIINVINKLRSQIPDISIRTTLIVGLPGETEEDFEELKFFVEEMEFDRLGVFEYSPEEGTPAAEMENQIDDIVKKERKDILMKLQQEIALKKNRAQIGKVLTVLTEEKTDDENVYIGRTQYDAPEIDNSVLFTSASALKKGTFVKVKITDAMEYDLIGEDINESAK
ncbi:MAG: 30S ribosomal protein S12 methylthiotransferase RimO [Clostridiales bacterium]|nr:30S ribosomal protein S12 methylthiotransferase RimO [Clostridiales bacterium]